MLKKSIVFILMFILLYGILPDILMANIAINELIEKVNALRMPNNKNMLKRAKYEVLNDYLIFNLFNALSRVTLARVDDTTREKIKKALKRPDVGTSEGSMSYHPSWSKTSIASAHFRVWYDADDTSHTHYASATYAQHVSNFMEAAYDYFKLEGFSPAAADMGILMKDNGTGSFPNQDDLYDVYIMDISAFGLTFPDYDLNNKVAGTSYIVIDNNITSSYGTQEEMLAITSIHEFFHALQLVFLKGKSSLPVWMMEGASTYSEDLATTLTSGTTNVTLDEVNDYQRYLSNFMSKPYVSMLDESSLHMYGNVLFFKMLSEYYSSSDYIGIMENIWETYDKDNYSNGVSAINAVLSSSYNSSFEEAFKKFLIWNYFTGSNNPPSTFTSGEGINKRYYEEDDGDDAGDVSQYPLVDIANSYNTYPVYPVEVSDKPDALAANYIEFVPESDYSKLLKIYFDGEGISSTVSFCVQLLLFKQNNTYDRVELSLDSNNSGSYEINDFGLKSTYKKVVMIPAVVSTTQKSGGYSYTYSASLGAGRLDPRLIHNLYNYPNPTTDGNTTIHFNILGTATVTVKILDVTGKRVKLLLENQVLDAGTNPQEVSWDGTNEKGQFVSNGVYYYKVIANVEGIKDSFEKYGKLVVLR